MGALNNLCDPKISVFLHRPFPHYVETELPGPSPRHRQHTTTTAATFAASSASSGYVLPFSFVLRDPFIPLFSLFSTFARVLYTAFTLGEARRLICTRR